MSLRRDRPRQREGKAWVPPPMWEALFAWSPLLSIVGAVTGGTLLIRLLLVSSNSSEYSFGPDIPIAGAVLLVWGVGVWAFMSPPSSSLAHEADGASMSGVIWPLGRRLRLWNIVAAPMLGLLLGMLSGPSLDLVTDVVSGGPPVSASDSTALVLGGVVLLGGWFVARLPLWGAEVRSDRLIVRGAMVTRHYRQSDIVSVCSYRVTGLADWILGILFNSSSMVFYTLRIRLANGRTRTLYASHSTKPDIDRAARVVTAWITPHSTVAATAPSLA